MSKYSIGTIIKFKVDAEKLIEYLMIEFTLNKTEAKKIAVDIFTDDGFGKVVGYDYFNDKSYYVIETENCRPIAIPEEFVEKIQGSPHTNAMTVSLSFSEANLDYFREKFILNTEEDIVDMIWDCINTYMEL